MFTSSRDAPPRPAACPVCGGTDLVPGEVWAQGMRGMPDAATGWARAFCTSTRARAHTCAACRNVRVVGERD